MLILLLFQFRCLFYFCLISLARPSRDMLNESSKSWYPCLVPYLREESFSFSPFNIMTSIDVVWMFFFMLRCVAFILHLCCVFIRKDVEFYQIPFLYLLRWSYGFCPSYCECVCKTIFVSLELIPLGHGV